jgi:nucleotide-binding universal stress UspA family protein
MDAMEREIADARAEFHAAVAPLAVGFEFRSSSAFVPMFDYIACEERSADLIIIGTDGGRTAFGGSPHVSAEDLVMRIGRPMLVVPESAAGVPLTHAVIGWKDTRETRRAALDALPLLKHDGQVSVVEISGKDDLACARERTQDVARWLDRLGVSATAHAQAHTGSDSNSLTAFADARQADLIVAGAYGHSRLREWVLGGVTRDLLTCTKRCAIVSH